MDLSIAIAIVVAVLAAVTVVIELIRLCFEILFASSKKEK